MSSNRAIGTCDAVLHRQDRLVGPIALPHKDVQSFVQDFNATYQSIGLSIEAIATTDQPADPIGGEVQSRRDASDVPAVGPLPIDDAVM